MAPVNEAGRDAQTLSAGASVHDRRVAPRGVLPRQLQTWLMVGIAGVIIAIIMITGHPQPQSSTRSTTGVPQPTLAPTDRIRNYQQRLADEEARQRGTLSRATSAGPADARTSSRDAGTTSLAPVERPRESRGLFADNIALTRRPGQPPSAERPLPRENASASVAAPSSLGLDPLTEALTRVLTQPPPMRPPTPAASSTPTAAAASARSATGAATPPPEGERLPETSTPPVREHPAPGPRISLPEGTVIEAVLLNRLDGTLASPVAGLVTTPVYAPDRQRVVIPAGARVLGTAAPVQAWGDARLAVSFHRLLMPDGHSYTLDRFTGLDAVGETGLRDGVNHHYLQVFGASLAIGALSGLAQYNTRSGVGVGDFGDAFRQAAGASLANSTTRVLDRYLNVLPTLTIREGDRFKVYLTNDLELPAYGAAAPGGLR